ncbi:MAG: hypothetical protein GF353_26870 [Candidatus Lokiarchaeota archaeon]|nr:hypothetical protein [Candidatus Lokiarchaeota archaeon]
MSKMMLEKFDQIGIVVEDIEKTADFYQKFFKFKGQINIVEQDATVVYKGKETTFSMKKVMQFFGGKQFEIVELVDIESTGDHLYKEFITEGNTGLHHLGIYVKNTNQYIDQYKTEFGVDVAQTGKVGKLSFTYIDTKVVLGYYIELIEF